MNRFYMVFLIFVITCSISVSQIGCSAKANAGIEISCQTQDISVFQGEKVILDFSITNNLLESLRPETGFFLSYHLYNEDEELVKYDNPRYKFPLVFRRKQTTRFKIPLFFGYKKPGHYIVEFDLVKEGEFWGSHQNWKTAKIHLHLKSLYSDEFKDKYLNFFCPTGNPIFDNEQYLLRITLKNCEIYRANGDFLGFSAGSDYPQVWIRDTATFIAYAKKYYSFKQLSTGIELFLSHQSPSGEVVDWVDDTGKTDKMTVETDQESSLVIAAFELGSSHPNWFLKKINAIPIYKRLEMALDWVWHEKRCPKNNLIYSGFTADWGDTENTFPDQRATKLSDQSTLVFSVYTNSKYIQAINFLIKIFKQIDKKKFLDKIQNWQKRLNVLKLQTLKMLYLTDKGYFIAHIVPGTEKNKYFEIEKEILAVGGNVEAILAGLMSKKEIEQWIKVLYERRKKYQLRTVSFTLIPPYPEGFFKHHLLKHPWSYQNGGEWDWIGGRVVKALYSSGFKSKADEYLLEIAKKNLSNFCIYEWEDKQGTGQGALFYIGAAGVIGDTILLRNQCINQ